MHTWLLTKSLNKSKSQDKAFSTELRTITHFKTTSLVAIPKCQASRLVETEWENSKQADDLRPPETAGRDIAV